jgi:hypothetical protein
MISRLMGIEILEKYGLSKAVVKNVVSQTPYAGGEYTLPLNWAHRK